MHKTLYIDIDEEITSIVDRVKKAEGKEIIIVAPKNAILLQSIVNLKLLKKEADRQKKQLLIVTQDKIGKKLIEKAGILAQVKAGEDIYLDAEPEENSYEPMYAKEARGIKKELQKENQEKEIGSSEYFDELISPKKERKVSSNPIEKKRTKSKVNMSDIVMGQSRTEKGKKESEASIAKAESVFPKSETNSFSQAYARANAAPPKISRVSIKKADKFFRGSRRIKKDFEIARVGGGAKKYFIFFAGIFAFFAVSAAAYFLLPKAVISLQLKNQEKAVSLDLIAEAKINATDSENNRLPAHLEQITKEITEEFGSTGSKDGGAKASGKVVIYNEFSAEDQPLVATTRLETEDGKIFRLTKNTVVPGISKIGDEKKPGAIEAAVVADQPGESGNIGPASFRIVGFRDTPSKYAKFYAKSKEPMTGGSSGAAKVITTQDITLAKEKIAAVGKKSAIGELKNGLPSSHKIFEDAAKIEISDISFSDNTGAEKEKFSVTAKVQASALSFDEADVKKIMRDNLARSDVNPDEISFDQPINYILADFNIQEKILKFQAKTDAQTASKLDLDNFKKGILGKTREEAQIYAKNFPAVEKIDIYFWPFFTTRIPMKESRVKIEMK